jgi:hypothetical protein
MSSCGKRARALIFLVTIFLMLVFPALAEPPKTAESTGECSSFAEAKKRMGQKSCIRGQVPRVEHSPEGISCLNFCEDSRARPFSVVIFAEDLHHVGALETPGGTRPSRSGGKCETTTAARKSFCRTLGDSEGNSSDSRPRPRNSMWNSRAGSP